MVGVIYKDSPKGLYTTSTDSDKTGSAPYSQLPACRALSLSVCPGHPASVRGGRINTLQKKFGLAPSQTANRQERGFKLTGPF